MKRGCFIRTVVIITILIAAILYILENKFDEYFLEPGKKYFSEKMKSGILEEINVIKQSPEKDSLKTMLNNFLEEIKESKSIEFAFGDDENLFSEFGKISADSIITKNELEDISKILKKIKNERLPKN